jgi:hypothetical protein
VEIRVEEYQVTWESLHDPSFLALPGKVRRRVPELFDMVKTAPRQVRDELEYYVARFPEVPCFQNWLTKCLHETGRPEEARALAERTVKRHPGYLTGITLLIQFRLWDNDLEGVERLLGPHKSLSSVVPGRKLFHISEFLSYFCVLGQYQLKTGDFKEARKSLKVMEDLAPRDPITEHLREYCRIFTKERVAARKPIWAAAG